MINITVRYGSSIIHGDGVHFINNWSLTKSRDDIDSFTFDIYPDNEYFNHVLGITNLYTLGLEVLDENGEQVFYGRCIDVSPQMDSNGLVYKAVTYEGCKSFLLDSVYKLDAFTKCPNYQPSEFYNNPEGMAQCVMYPYDIVSNTSPYTDNVIDPNYVTVITRTGFNGWLDGGNGIHWNRLLDPNVSPLMEDNNYAIKAVDLVHSAIAYHNLQMYKLGGDAKYVTFSVEGSWGDYYIYKSEEYDSPTLDAINSIIEEAGAEMFASYDTTNDCVHLRIADRVYDRQTGTRGTISLQNNMISCVQDEAPDELVSAVEIYVDGVSQDKVASINNEDIAWSRNWRVSLEAIMRAIDEDPTTGTSTEVAEGWLDDVFDEFRNDQYDATFDHDYDYRSGFIVELNSNAAYNEHPAQLTLSGLINWSDYEGWEKLKVIPDDDDNSNDTPWFHTVIDDLVDENLFKRISRLGIAWLNERCRVVPSVSVSAADMALIDVNYEDLEVGTWWRVTNSLINLDDILEIVSITYKQGSEHIPDVTLGRRPHRSVDTTIHVRKRADDTNKQSSSDSLSDSRGTTTNMMGSGSGKSASATGGTDWRFQIVSEAPQVGVENTVYFVIPSSS